MKKSFKKWLILIIIGFLMVACLALNPGPSYSFLGKILYKIGGFLLFFPVFAALLWDIGIVKGKERIPFLKSNKKGARITFWTIVVMLGLVLFFSFSSLSKIGKIEPAPQHNDILPNSNTIEQQEHQLEEAERTSNPLTAEKENPSTSENMESVIVPSQDRTNDMENSPVKENEADTPIPSEECSNEVELLEENQVGFEIDPHTYNLGDLSFNIEKIILTQNTFKQGSYSYDIDMYVTVKNNNENSMVNFLAQRTGGQAGVYYGQEECIIKTAHPWGNNNRMDSNGIPKDYIFRIVPSGEEKVCMTTSYISTDDINALSELKMDLYFTAINTDNPDQDRNETEIRFDLIK